VSPCCIQALPSVIPQIFPQIPGPLPRWLTRCIYPFLPLSHRPSPYRHWVGSTTTLRSTTSERRCLTRLQSFDNLQASEFAATQVVPTAGIQSGCQGGRGVYIRAERGSLPPHGRVGDWRAGLGRSLCSLFPRPFGCEVSQHRDRATFPVPATSNAAYGFPSLRSPACFASRVMGPILLGRLSAEAVEPCSR
jgi:hypothetical protein